MSEVISFRLNHDNLREAKTLLILQDWIAKGYSLRQIITDALLKLDKNEHDPESIMIGDLTEALSKVNFWLMQIEGSEPPSVNYRRDGQQNDDLPDSFIASVKSSAKLGLEL